MHLELLKNIPVLKLNFSTRNLLSKLIHLTSENGHVDMYVEDIANLINASERTVARSSKQLRDNGLISVKQNNAKSKLSGRLANTWTVNWHELQVTINERIKYLHKNAG
jgi:predicted transcriptional regulator